MDTTATALAGAVDRGEISAWYQPQLDLRSGLIVSAEALCRWQLPSGVFVPPVDFIPVAEDIGLIDEIGRFMAAEACAAIVEWAQTGSPIDLSVNVSPLQLRDTGFAEWLSDEVRRSDFRNQALTIEITESHPVEDIPAVLTRLELLSSEGVGISIDDYGAGLASLDILRRLHGTELKIDRALVTDESHDARLQIAVAVEVAHEADVRVVAEGVETASQLVRMREIGCDRAQGYLIGHPAPREDFARLHLG